MRGKSARKPRKITLSHEARPGKGRALLSFATGFVQTACTEPFRSQRLCPRLRPGFALAAPCSYLPPVAPPSVLLFLSLLFTLHVLSCASCASDALPSLVPFLRFSRFVRFARSSFSCALARFSRVLQRLYPLVPALLTPGTLFALVSNNACARCRTAHCPLRAGASTRIAATL